MYKKQLQSTRVNMVTLNFFLSFRNNLKIELRCYLITNNLQKSLEQIALILKLYPPKYFCVVFELCFNNTIHSFQQTY